MEEKIAKNQRIMRKTGWQMTWTALQRVHEIS